MSKTGATKKLKKMFFNPDSIMTSMQSSLEDDLRNHPLFDRMEPEDWRRYFCNVQIEGFSKRYVSPFADQKSLEEATITKFKTSNDVMEKANCFLSTVGNLGKVADVDPAIMYPTLAKLANVGSSSVGEHDIALLLTGILRTARYVVKQTLGKFDMDEFLSSGKNGPGSTCGVPFLKACEEEKFTFPITATLPAADLFDLYLRLHPRMYEAIGVLNGNARFVRYRVVEGSSATTVPKNKKIRRFISREPTVNMFLQQSAKEMMEPRLASIGLDVSILPMLHRQKARASSITHENATIDMSEASNRIAYELVKLLLPPDWFHILDKIRSPFIMLGESENVRSFMFSTMGNACTFPLETLVFYSLAVSVCHWSQKPSKTITYFPNGYTRSSVSVFGDDCILPTRYALQFMRVLELLGMEVNSEKSYYREEGFRESCGGDYLRGMDVRPFCPKGPHGTRKRDLEAWLYVVLNNILPLYRSYFGYWASHLDKSLLVFIFGLFREHDILVKIVPPDYPSDAGILSSTGSNAGAGMTVSDLVVMIELYGAVHSPISRSDQGVYSFKVLRYEYPKKRKHFPLLRYVLALNQFERLGESELTTVRMRKNLTLIENALYYHPESKDFDGKDATQRNREPLKKGGSYVVRTGHTSIWTV